VAAVIGLAMLAPATLAVGQAGASTSTGATTSARAADPTLDIVQTAQAAGSFTTLLAAAQAAGLVDALKAPGPYTVFAPTDAAFATLLGKLHVTAEQLLASKDLLGVVLKYHVLSGKVLSSDLPASTDAPTLLGPALRITKDASGVTINGSAHVTTADVLATNGVIHVIDAVLIPIPPIAPPAPANDIVTVATNAGGFKTLLAAAKAAGLVDALKAPGPYTVFAPTDAAFARLLKRLHVTPAQLLAQPGKVASILKYHVIAGKVPSSALGRRTVATTLNGKKVAIRKYRVWAGRGRHRHLVTKVTVNGFATVVKADVMASNGVIHAIDRVLVP
jgi:uncharacterized surface protein with fasciclin (FAS1) repeats